MVESRMRLFIPAVDNDDEYPFRIEVDGIDITEAMNVASVHIELNAGDICRVELECHMARADVEADLGEVRVTQLLEHPAPTSPISEGG